MSTCLSHLPNELLLLIIDNVSRFPPEEARRALNALCLTSQRLRHLAEPHLYFCVSNDHNTDKPHLFPSTLVARPALCDHVQKLHLHIGDKDALNPMPEDTLRCLRKGVDDLNLPDFLAANIKGYMESFGAHRAAACHELALILVSRNLKALCLQIDNNCSIGVDGVSMINHILFDSPNWSGMFDKVHSVLIVPPNSTRKPELYNLAYLFKMPNLRRFEIMGCKDRRLGQSLGWNGEGQLAGDLGKWREVENSNVETIIIRKSNLGHCAVNVLLNCCKALKHVSVEMTKANLYFGRFQFFRLEEAVCRHAATLEHLSIVHRTKGIEETAHHYLAGTLLFLPQLHALRSAVFPLVAMPHGFIDGSPAPMESFEEAEIRSHLPPSSQKISICNGNVHYGGTSGIGLAK